MIGRLAGQLCDMELENEIIVDVGGVGYRLTVPLSTMNQLPGVGNDVTLHIHTHVRDDGIALYGFYERAELRLFQTLISVSGIGPRLALTILSHFAPDGFAEAVINEDADRLTKVPGIGKKTAARLLVELKDVMKKEWILSSDRQPVNGRKKSPTLSAVETDVAEALASLGFSEEEIQKALAQVIDESGSRRSVTELIQLSLRHLDRGAS